MADKKSLVAAALILAGIAWFAASNSEPVSEAAKIKEACAALENKETCYGKAFAAYTRKTDMAQAFETLHELQAIEPSARGCHFIAHSISIAETEKDPGAWREVMAAAPQECSYGAAHGALEVHASKNPDGRLAPAEIPTICPDPDLKNCMHILGHLLLVMTEDDIDQSLRTCEDTKRSEYDVFECLTGVFMERITALNLETHGLAGIEALNWPSRLPELETLCRAQGGQRAVACWKEIVHAAAAKYGPDMSAVASFCARSPIAKAASECVDHAVGIIGGMLDFDFARTKGVCEAPTSDPTFRARCYPNLVSSTLSTIPTEVPQAEAFCRALASPYREPCLARAAAFKNGGSAARSPSPGMD